MRVCGVHVRVRVGCACARAAAQPGARWGGQFQRTTRANLRHTRESSPKIHSLANLAAARATCQPAAAARRSQARRGGAFSADHRDDAAAGRVARDVLAIRVRFLVSNVARRAPVAR